MFTGSTLRLLARSVVSISHARSSSRVVPRIAGSIATARSFTSTIPALNTSAAPEEVPAGYSDKEEFDLRDQLGYILTESRESDQKTLINELTDFQLSHLPIVISKRSKHIWTPMDNGLTLPFRSKPEDGTSETDRFACGEYLYNTYAFATIAHVHRFSREFTLALEKQFHPSAAVMLLDPRTRSLTIGLPSYVGIQPPFPAKDNTRKIITKLKYFRDETTPQNKKDELAKQLRQNVVAHGFKVKTHLASLYLIRLRKTIKNATVDQLADPTFVINSAGEVSKKKQHEQRAQESRRRKQTAAAKSPEASVFVAHDGDAHKGSEKEVDGLQEHVPFPRPSAQEMGIEKPKATDSKQSFAGKLAAHYGDAHKGTEKAADVWHVSFPTPSAEEVGSNKPNASQPDDPKQPEAGTFVAQDGDAHKGTEKEADGLQEHVPFPTPSAEEMGIKKPTES